MVLVLLVIVAILAVTAPFWINWIWFGSVGYRSVITTNYINQLISFLVVGVIAAALFYVNVRMALRNSTRFDIGEDNRIGRFSNAVIRWISLVGAVVIGVLAGLIGKDRWVDLALYLNGKSFGVSDPTFHRDAGFYVFQLPFYTLLAESLLLLLFITILAVAFVYLIRIGIRFRRWGEVPMVAVRHISALISAILLVLAFNYVLNNFELVFSQRGVVTGPGFTDVNVVRWLNYLMALISVVVAIGLLFGRLLRNLRWLLILLGSWFVLAVVVTPLLPMAVQRLIVEPNEFSRERTSIENNIAMTRAGFDLSNVDSRELTGQDPIVASSLSPDRSPLNNVRIWDYRVVGPYYQQVQSFVPSFQFPDVDIDRYQINGQTEQMLVGVRELDINGLAANRQTWTNTHLVYTHGYGFVMSPVSKVNSDGWPELAASGIPLQVPEGMTVDRPEIYFGETDMNWIILHTNQAETTGLTANEESGGFQGDVYGSIGLGNPVTRAMAALSLGDRNVLLSAQLTGESRLVQTRNVLDRAERIAPFLEYDQDPYAVVSDGRIYWIIDAYTSTNQFPHATRYDGENYLRNSVKVVVDAYSGQTWFYRTGMDDPIADAWGSIYKDLFTPVSEAPAGITAHFRYPEMMFSAQADVWSDYHTDDARSWYDGDDKWSIANETSSGERTQMEPYFVNQVLPGDDAETFALTLPFTPGGNTTRENMTAWFAGTSDETGDTYLRLYRYPRQVTVYGPRQIEAQINQDPEISQQITLWSQGGSQVVRGNMMVIPINDAMLYVQPLYLEAAGSTASAPRLARVIVATHEQVVMRPTLSEAIAALEDPNAEVVDQIEANPDQAVQPMPTPSAAPTVTAAAPAMSADLAAMTDAELTQEALTTYNAADTAQRNGDWAAYGELQTRLGAILEEMNRRNMPAATPAG